MLEHLFGPCHFTLFYIILTCLQLSNICQLIIYLRQFL